MEVLSHVALAKGSDGGETGGIDCIRLVLCRFFRGERFVVTGAGYVTGAPVADRAFSPKQKLTQQTYILYTRVRCIWQWEIL